MTSIGLDIPSVEMEQKSKVYFQDNGETPRQLNHTDLVTKNLELTSNLNNDSTTRTFGNVISQHGNSDNDLEMEINDFEKPVSSSRNKTASTSKSYRPICMKKSTLGYLNKNNPREHSSNGDRNFAASSVMHSSIMLNAGTEVESTTNTSLQTKNSKVMYFNNSNTNQMLIRRSHDSLEFNNNEKQLSITRQKNNDKKSESSRRNVCGKGRKNDAQENNLISRTSRNLDENALKSHSANSPNENNQFINKSHIPFSQTIDEVLRNVPFENNLKQIGVRSGNFSKKNNSVMKQSGSNMFHFVELEHEPRIYVAAPSGVPVTRIKAIDLRNPDFPIMYTIHSSTNDKQFFQVHGESGNITTRRYIEKKAGETYNITIVAHGRERSIMMDLEIHVTEYNRFSPVFEKINYTVDLDVLTPVPTEFLTVKAIDKDFVKYNSEVYYSLLTIHDMVSVNRTTGVLTLNKSLPPTYKHLAFTIIAKDGGSPPRIGKTKLTINIKILSAPLKLTIVETGDRWVMVCWKHPLSGNSLGYLVLIHNNVSSFSRNFSTTELGVKNNLMCASVDNLQKWRNYSIQVAGWNYEEVGIKTPALLFTTRVNRTCHSVNATDYVCTCLPGYYGIGCSLFNPCNSSEPPCQNGGTCYSNASNVFTCECPQGYYGSSCKYFNPCSKSPCQHNSACINITSSKYECQCVPGYTGNRCETDIDDCDPYPCFNNGTCLDGLNQYTCICHSGFEGHLCQYNIDECLADPCQNGAVCIDKLGSYVCDCPRGYDGDNCENNIDDCQSNPCENNATCIDRIDDYFCDCQAGFEGDYCEDEIDECMSLPCLNGGVCTDAFNDFSCDCPSGYNGKRCEWDVDLCQSQPCQNGAECIDLVDHFSCKCQQGYEGTYCELKVQCPAEVLQTERGTFLWKPVEHGIISRLPCPYGMDTNYTELYSHQSEYHIPNTSSQVPMEELIKYNNKRDKKTNLFNYIKKNKNRFKRLSVTYKLKDTDKQQFIENDQLRIKMESRLQIDNEGIPYAVRSCLQLNNGSVRWADMVDSICRDKHSTLIEKLSQELEKLTKDPAQINIQVFINTSIQIGKILEYAISDKKIAQSMFSVISNMMAVNETVLENADKSGNITASLIQVIDIYSSSAKLSKSGKIAIVSENLALETREYLSSSRITSNSLTYSPPKLQVKDSAIVLEDGTEVVEENQDILINIPREAVDKALKQMEILRIQFVSYRNSKFFRSNNVNASSLSRMITKQQVISASVSGIHIENLTDPLEYTFHNLYGNAKQKCVYWDPESQEWLDDGIQTNQSTEWIQCQSSHMTAFSVLLDPQLGMAIPDKHRQLLSIISYIGSTCSIIGLFLTILTYSMFRCLNRDRSGKIVLNLSISLLLMNIAFLLVTLEEYLDSRQLIFIDICTGVAVLTHYLVLTSLMWMLVEALNMYQLLITVFATAETRFMCKRMFCAWGVPLVIVGGTVWYDTQFYNSTEAQYCMVTTSKPILYYVAYLGPSCLILVINCIVFILVSKVLFQRRIHAIGKVGSQSDSPVITVAQIRGAFTVMTLLGVTWVFGALALGEAKLVFQYIFCISNSLQGFIIFVVRCVQYPEARMAWITFIHTGKLKKHRGPQGGYGMPSSSHSRHTMSSSTHSELQSRHRSSSTRKSSRNSSLWNRFNKREPPHRSNTYSYSNSSFHNTFGSSCSSDYKPQSKCNYEKEAPLEGSSQTQGTIVGDGCRTTPTSEKLRKSTDFLSRSQSMDMSAMCSKSSISLSSEHNRQSCSLKLGSSIRLKDSQISPVQEKQQSGSQQSLSTKEGEDTSWQFMRAPPDGMSESKPSAIAESQTTNHSHSDQGYMSGVCTAEQSPESPRMEPKQAMTIQQVPNQKITSESEVTTSYEKSQNEGNMKTSELYDVMPTTEENQTDLEKSGVYRGLIVNNTMCCTPPQSQPCHSYSSSEENSNDSVKCSMELQPQIIQLSPPRKSVYNNCHQSKTVRCEDDV